MPVYRPLVSPPRRRRVPGVVWVIGGVLVVLLVLGLLATLVAGLVAGGIVYVSSRPQVTSQSTRTFLVSDTPQLVVHHQAGDITVVAGTSNQITVEVIKKARDVSQSDAQRDLDRIQVNLTQQGNTVTATATGDWNTTVAQQLTADLRISVPATTNLEVTLQAGTLTLTRITGGLEAQVTAGRVVTSALTLTAPSQITMTTGEAEVDASLAKEAALTVTVTTGSVRLTLPAATPAHLDASVNVGSITVTGWSIPVTHQGAGATATGDLTQNPVNQLTIRVTTGDIHFSTR